MRARAVVLALSAVLITPAHTADSGTGKLENTEPGLQTATFDTLSGTVSVHLPDEIVAGDTISGTVVAEPDGDDDKKREKNLGTLTGYVLEIEEENEDEDERVADGRLTVDIPETPTRDNVVSLVLREIKKGKPGREIGRVELPLRPPSEIPDTFRLPTVGQTGRAAVVRGPFDGDLATSGLTVGDFDALPLAESPRMAVFRSPREIVGVAPVELRERGETVAEGELRNVAVSLAAPKLNLMKGESTTLTTVVTGLEDLDEEIPFELDVWPTAVVAVEGGNRHDLVIRPEDVDASGTYSLRLRVSGRRAGGWNAEATVEVPEPDPPADRYVLVLEGETVGTLQSVTGGTISGDPERITFEAGLELEQPLYDWMQASFDKGHVTKSGEILGCDSSLAEREVHEFHEAIIESVTFPRLDPEDDTAAIMTITLAPASVREQKGSGKRVDVQPATKKWLCSNFRFELGGLSVERVSSIDSFTWKQGTKLSVSTADVDSWELWHRAFVLEGDATAQPTEGRLVLLAPDRIERLATLSLTESTMASLAVGSNQGAADGTKSVTIELVDSAMSFERENP